MEAPSPSGSPHRRCHVAAAAPLQSPPPPDSPPPAAPRPAADPSSSGGSVSGNASGASAALQQLSCRGTTRAAGEVGWGEQLLPDFIFALRSKQQAHSNRGSTGSIGAATRAAHGASSAAAATSSPGGAAETAAASSSAAGGVGWPMPTAKKAVEQGGEGEGESPSPSASSGSGPWRGARDSQADDSSAGIGSAGDSRGGTRRRGSGKKRAGSRLGRQWARLKQLLRGKPGSRGAEAAAAPAAVVKPRSSSKAGAAGGRGAAASAGGAQQLEALVGTVSEEAATLQRQLAALSLGAAASPAGHLRPCTAADHGSSTAASGSSGRPTDSGHPAAPTTRGCQVSGAPAGPGAPPLDQLAALSSRLAELTLCLHGMQAAMAAVQQGAGGAAAAERPVQPVGNRQVGKGMACVCLSLCVCVCVFCGVLPPALHSRGFSQHACPPDVQGHPQDPCPIPPGHVQGAPQ